MATKSSKATFKHCPKLKDAYTGSLEMLALISSVCIHSNVRHHTELFEKSNKIKEPERLTLNQPQKFGKPLQLAFCEEWEEKFFWEKKLSVYLFANPFST